MKWLNFSLRQTVIGGLILLWMILWLWGRNLEFNRDFAPVVYAGDGQILSASVAGDAQWRMYCSTGMPPRLATSIRLFEDQYFYYHPGINPVSILKAMWDNIRAKRIVRGGSTLTMQVARLYYHRPERTYLQKIKEMALSLALECSHSKEQILQFYGQYAPFGGNIIGYHAASRLYFGKSPQHLSWGECATLAVLPNAPSDIYPGKGQQRLVLKRNRLLKKLLKKGFIDSTTYRLSRREQVPVRKYSFGRLAPHLLSRLNHTRPKTNQYRTTIDFALQQEMASIAQRYANRYSGQGIDNLAILVLSNDGRIRAYVANTSCSSELCGSQVDLIQAPRSPGSILKPFLYGRCLDEGRITPTSLLRDIPVFHNGFSPKNFDQRFRGIVPAADALTQSLNVPAVNLLKTYGVDAFHKDLHDLGFGHISRPASHYGLALILGGCETTMYEIGRAYTNLSRVAQGKAPIHLRLLQNTIRDTLLEPYPISRPAAWQVLQILKGVNRPERQDGWQYFTNQRVVSWKTGTSYGYRDAWSVGVTRDYTVVVWVGNADGEGRKGLTGIKKAAPVLFSALENLPMAKEIEEPYNSFKPKVICSESGYTPSPACPALQTIYVPQNSHHLPLCTYHRTFKMDSSGHYRVKTPCTKDIPTTNKSLFVLDPVVNTYYRRFYGSDYSAPPIHPDCQQTQTRIDILYPPDQATVLLPTDIDNREKGMICEATAPHSMDSLYWFLDGELQSILGRPFKMEVLAPPGHHFITIVAPDGNSRTHHFEIIE